jgi:heme A synthase
VARAVVISLHLVNTLILMGAAALTAWWAGGEPAFELSRRTRLRPWLFLAMALMIVTSMTGAVTALGDTLFPVDPTLGDGLLARIRDDLSPANHFLVRLRIVHPFVAVVAAAVIFGVSGIVRYSSEDQTARRLAVGLAATVGLQTILGVVNVALHAPGWMQLAHLATAQVLWVFLVLILARVQTGPHTGRPEGEGL